MKHLFIVNPVAGGKDRREYVAEQARRALEGSEDAYEVYVTTAPMDAAPISRRPPLPPASRSGCMPAAATARSTSASTAPSGTLTSP